MRKDEMKSETVSEKLTFTPNPLIPIWIPT